MGTSLTQEPIMIVIHNDQERPITIHAGPDGVVILTSGQTTALTFPTLPAQGVGILNEKNVKLFKCSAKQIMPYVIITALAVWGGQYLFSGHNTPPASPMRLQRPDLPTRSGPDIPHFPADIARSQPAQPTPQDNPNSAFGLN